MLLMWMPAQTTVPPLRRVAKRLRNQLSGRREENRRVHFLRRCLVGAAGPGGPQLARKLLAISIAGLGEGEDFASLPASDLRDDVRGRAETVDPEAPGVAGSDQRAIADQSGAEQRRRFGVRVFAGRAKQ
jgi:hypothetical protein